jgi:hypothetical protein
VRILIRGRCGRTQAVLALRGRRTSPSTKVYGLGRGITSGYQAPPRELESRDSVTEADRIKSLRDWGMRRRRRQASAGNMIYRSRL